VSLRRLRWRRVRWRDRRNGSFSDSALRRSGIEARRCTEGFGPREVLISLTSSVRRNLRCLAANPLRTSSASHAGDGGSARRSTIFLNPTPFPVCSKAADQRHREPSAADSIQVTQMIARHDSEISMEPACENKS
jgi:hypothetical protein